MKRRISTVTIVLMLLHTCVVAAAAQEVAGSFDQLRVLVKPGDRITVTDDAGRQTTGRLAELSASSLALVVGDERRDLQATDISTILQRRPDSLANGTKWGFGIGAAFGFLAGLGLANAYDEAHDSALMAVGALIYGGLGAGIGAGLDAMIAGNQVIYARRAAVSVRF
jgi:hypothetical protein